MSKYKGLAESVFFWKIQKSDGRFVTGKAGERKWKKKKMHS